MELTVQPQDPWAVVDEKGNVIATGQKAGALLTAKAKAERQAKGGTDCTVYECDAKGRKLRMFPFHAEDYKAKGGSEPVSDQPGNPFEGDAGPVSE